MSLAVRFTAAAAVLLAFSLAGAGLGTGAFSGAASASTGSLESGPSINFQNLRHYSRLSGTHSFGVAAADDVGVTRIELYVDFGLVTTRNVSPPSPDYVTNFSVDTKQFKNGRHSISARAFDADGNSSTAIVAIITSNSFNDPTPTPTPTPPPAGSNIVLNPSVRYQTMTGWEATAQAGQDYNLPSEFPQYPSSSFANYKQALLDATLDLGINRLRVEVRLGDETTEAYDPGADNTPVNDNSSPFSTNLSRFNFDRLERQMDELVIPLRNALAARGEQLWVNLCVVDFDDGRGFRAEDNPEEYAEFVLVFVNHFFNRYGFRPNSIEAVLEADLNSSWSRSEVANNIVAAHNRLVANGHTGITWIAPSNTDGNTVQSWWSSMRSANSAVNNAVSEISYHKYAGMDDQTLTSLRNAAAADGKKLAMLELGGADYHDLHQDLAVGRASAWQQFTLTFPYSGVGDDGYQYFRVNTSNWQVSLWSRTRFLRQYFKFVRLGAEGIGATSSTNSLEPLAFVNPNGKYTVVVKANAGRSFNISGLPAGLYGIKYTTSSQYDVDLPDYNVTGGGLLTTSIPSTGVITIYRK